MKLFVVFSDDEHRVLVERRGQTDYINASYISVSSDRYLRHSSKIHILLFLPKEFLSTEAKWME